MSPRRAAATVLSLVAAATAGSPGVPQAQESRPAIRGIVYYDRNRNGERDPGESGHAGVFVSNGRDLTKTAGDGSFTLPAAADRSDTAFVVRGTALDATTPWFAPVATRPAGLEFGVISSGRPGRPVAIAHVADVSIESAADASDVLETIRAIARSQPNPSAVVVTRLGGARYGDLVANAGVPVVAPGLPGEPPVSAFDAGACMVVCASGDARRAEELIQQLSARIPAGQSIVVAGAELPAADWTRILAPLPQASAVLSATGGHATVALAPDRGSVHSLLCETPPLRVAGDSHSPRAWRFIQFDVRREDRAASVTSEVRPLGAHRRAQFIWPQAGAAVPLSTLDVRASCADTFARVATARVEIADARGLTVTSELKHRGGSLYGATLDLTTLSPGRATAILRVGDDLGSLWETRNSFGIITNEPAPASRPSGDWPCERGTTSGVPPGTLELRPPLRLVWSQALDSFQDPGAPIVIGERLLLCGEGPQGRGSLAALDVRTGALLWRSETPRSLGNAWIFQSGAETGAGEPVEKKRFHFLGVHGTGHSMLADGEIHMEPNFVMNIAFQRGRNRDIAGFIGARPDGPRAESMARILQNRLSGFLAKDGLEPNYLQKPDWTAPGVASRAPTLVAGGRVLAVLDGKLASIDARTGNPVWQNPNPLGSATGSPVPTATGTIVVPADDAVLYGIDAATGSTRWSWDRAHIPLEFSVPGRMEGREIGGTPVAAGNYCYFGCTDGRVYAIDTRSGLTAWWFRLGAPVAASPAATGNLLFFATRDGQVHAFAATPEASSSK
jgi:hypothetical protein